jgi:hypothetical protein
VLVVGNFLITLHNLNDFLTKLFNTDLVIYAILALLLIVMQGAPLDGLTSFCRRNQT